MLGDDKFCPRCASTLEERHVEGISRPVCSGCSHVHYYDPKVTAAAVVERGGKVLMVRRATQPGVGLWSLPAGYVDRGEQVEVAAQREVLEETGLEVQVTELLGVFSEPSHPVILVTYDSRIIGGDLKAGPEILELDFFSIDALPPLAFSRDVHVLEAWHALRDGHR